MQRVCFLLKVRESKLVEYKERHASVWPEMLTALKASGWNNYSIFLDDTGLLVGYLETEDFDAALASMAETDINAKWQASMTPYFEDLNDAGPDERMRVLPLIFQLESQLDMNSHGDNT
jgi:L-rhamnose mutarotase